MHDISNTDLERRTLGSLLLRQAAENGDAVWMMMGDETWTFGAGHIAVEAIAANLSERGICRGDIVATMLDNSTDNVFLVLALARLGAVQVPINTAYNGEFLRNLLEETTPKAVVVEDIYLNILYDALVGLPPTSVVVRGDTAAAESSPGASGFAELRAAGRCSALADVSYTDLATVMYTSGTTGRSKGAMMSHGYWWTISRTLCVGRDVRVGDVLHMCTPMFHAGAWLVGIYPSLLYGIPVGVEERFSVNSFFDGVRRFGATQLWTLGAMSMWLWNLPPCDDDVTIPARVWGCIPLPSSLWVPFKERYGLDGVCSAFGQTELSCITITDMKRQAKAGSAGWVQPDVEVVVLDDADRPVGPNEVGELAVRPKVPETMFQGYFRKPDETLAAFRNLWFHTGDMVRIDEDGELFFVDRRKDYLRRRGENISSMEVEAAVATHPGVALAVIFGVPSQDTEDEVMLCVVLKAEAHIDPGELFEHCVANMPYYCVPRYIEIVEDVEVTPSGKVQKYILRNRGVTDATWDSVAAGVGAQRLKRMA